MKEYIASLNAKLDGWSPEPERFVLKQLELLSSTKIPPCIGMHVNKNKVLVICVGCSDIEKHSALQEEERISLRLD